VKSSIRAGGDLVPKASLREMLEFAFEMALE